MRRLVVVCALAMASTVSMSPLPPPPVIAAPARPVTRPACRAAAETPDAAASLARACGGRVEVAAARTEMAELFALSDGSFTRTEHVVPQRARHADGSWGPIDPALRFSADGEVRTGNTVVPVRLSAGGSGAFATATLDGREFGLAWPDPLPRPELAGDTAVYHDVLPGVDLRVTASALGFSEVLVVKDAVAALNPALDRIRFRPVARGVTPREQGGGLALVDDSGRQVFFVPPPMMWDSTPDGAGSGAAPMSMQVTGGDLVLRPDPERLRGPRVTYPVFMDPSVIGGILDNAWTMVIERSDMRSQSGWQRSTFLNNGSTKGNIGAGLNRDCDTCASYLVRTIFRMNINGARNTHLQNAKFRIEQRHASTCNGGGSNAKLWITGAISSATSWNNQPTWGVDGLTAVTPGNHRSDQAFSCAGPGVIEFDATAMVQDAYTSGWADLNLGLAAENESTMDQWKRFFYETAELALTFNSYPTLGAVSTSPATSCVTGNGSTPAANRPLINDTTPDLMVVTNDPDVETDLKGRFEWQAWIPGSPPLSQWSPNTTVATDPIGRANGGQSVVTASMPTGIYRWRVTVTDPWNFNGASGADVSATSAWCEVQTDDTPPPDPAVSSTEYPRGCAPCGGIGTTGRFTVNPGASDIEGYWWGFSDPPNIWVPVTSTASYTFDWTPAAGRPFTLFVKTKDFAGNTSGRYDHPFTVDGADPLRARWRLAELPDDEGNVPPLADSSGNGFTAAMAGGGTVGAEGRLPGATAALFDGVDDVASTAGPVVDTSRSFSVAAWVQLAGKSNGSHTIAAQGGTSNSAFALEYVKSGTVDVWKFTAPTSDTPTASYPGAESVNGGPQVGRWTHLAGVYDSAGRTLKLYVNGTLVQTRTGVTAWSAAGPLRIGQHWSGSIVDVRIWPRVLFDGELRDLVDPLGEASAGEYHFNEVDSSFALDSSPYAHTLFLSGGARIPPAGAGYDGTGLLLMDGTGQAVGSGPSVFTTQSFTVSAWVRLDGTTLPTRNYTAVGQSGTYVSGFYLGYRINNGNPTWAFVMPGTDSAGAGGGLAGAGSAPLTTAVLGRWVQLRGTYDAATGATALYVDGKLAGSGTRGTPMPDVRGGLTIGAALWTPTGGSPALTDGWVGAIDEVRIHAGVVPVLAGDWRFDSCTGVPVICVDNAVPAHPVTLFGDATWVPTGQGEGAGLALGGTGYASTAGPVVDTGTSFTVSAWVKLTDTSSNLCAVCLDGNRVDAFVLGYQRFSDRWAFWAHAGDTDETPATTARPTTPPALNTWTHLTGVYDAVAGQIRLYVNGQLVATTPFTSGWTASGPLVMGREKWNGTATNFWRGSIDDVRVYPGVLGSTAYLIDPRPQLVIS